MSHIPELRVNAAELIARGDHAAAIRMYESSLAADLSLDERIALKTDLVNACVRVSLHGKALAHAASLESDLKLPAYHRIQTRIAALLVTAGHLAPSRPVGSVLTWLGMRLARTSRRSTAPWPAIRALQFAHFWNNIERCVFYAIQQLAVAKTADERSASLAWLSYAMSYRGISWLSVSLLEKAIRDTKARKATAQLADFYPLLGLSYLMTGRSADATQAFDDYDRDFKDAPEFYKLLTLTARINLNIESGNLVEAQRAIGRCFSYSFSMDKSRHHIQIYGASAALAAVEGRQERALRDLKLSEQAAAANDNSLDSLLYYRYAVLVHLNLQDIDAAKRALESFRINLLSYGEPLWYRTQYEEMRGLVQCPTWSLGGAMSVWLRCLFYSLTSLNFRGSLALVMKARLHLFVERRNHWPPGSVTAYLMHRLASLPVETRNREASNFSEKVSQAILDLGRQDDNLATRPTDIVELVGRIFPDATVLTATTLKGLVAAARELVDTDGFTIFDDQCLTIRVPSSDRRFLLGLVVPKLHDGAADQAIGILASGLDVHSVPFAEAALKLVVSDFASLSATKALQERQAKDRELVAVGRAAQLLAHDIRRPFSLITAGLSVLGRAETPEALKASTAQLKTDVDNSLQRVNAMIADVIQAGAPLNLDCNRDDLRSLIETTVDNIQRSLPALQAALSVKLRHRAEIDADRVKLGRAFENILINAFQATAGQGRIWMQSRDVEGTRDASVEIIIGNDGPPIAAESMARLFDPFFTSGKRGGTGLGLAITRNILRAHGGDASCRSSSNGTEFVVTLPAKVASQHPKQCREKAGWVALADDSPFVLDAWAHALKDLEVMTFKSGEDLLTEVHRRPELLDDLSCVVTDYHFGDGEMSGSELLDALRNLDATIPVILASDGEFPPETRRRFDQVIAKMAVTPAVVRA